LDLNAELISAIYRILDGSASCLFILLPICIVFACIIESGLIASANYPGHSNLYCRGEGPCLGLWVLCLSEVGVAFLFAPLKLDQ